MVYIGARTISTLVLSTIVLSAGSSSAGMLCKFVHTEQLPAVKALVQYDAFKQWTAWEQTANLAKYAKTGDSQKMPTLRLSRDEVNIQVDPNLPASVLGMFTAGTQVRWIKHPYNTHSSTPHLNAPTTENIPAYFTASRSMALTGRLRGFTIKVPTDRPHGPEGEHQPGKANTADDVLSALLHSEHINSRDQKMGLDDKLIVLPEVLTVADKATNIGYVIRDVRKTDDGHYYLPAMSIPYVGREIAKINGLRFEQFWEKNYAAVLGEAKAKMLLRYGLQMETPNPQNMLIQLDRNLKPTGRIAFRDVSDAFFVYAAAEGLGFQKAMEKDTAAEYNPVVKLQPFVSNSLWRLDQAGDKSVSQNAMAAWAEAHNLAYIDYVLRSLNLTMTTEQIGRIKDSDGMPGLYELLGSPEGQAALKAYREKSDREQMAEAG